jgi:LysR family transcriptional regulator, hydrogen peroxide-inducible genes activator
MILPTLRQLEYFVGIADHGSFRAAADACLVTQPALSTQIQQLERLLSTQLFERGGRKVMLTQTGQQLLPRARAVLQGTADMVEAAQALRQPLTGTLRLGVIPTIAPYLLPTFLAQARRDFPKLRLLLHEGQTSTIVSLLQKGKLDLLLLALDVDLEGAIEHFLYNDPFLLAVPADHSFASRSDVQRADLKHLELLLLADGHCLREHAFEACNLQSGQEIGDFRATSLNTLVRMVSNGVGTTLLPKMAIGHEVHDLDSLAIIPFTEPVPSRKIGLAWRKNSARSSEFKLLAELLG